MSKNNRPSVEYCLMETAKIWAKRGTCLRPSTILAGSVIYKNGRIISVGYIGAPPGKPHCKDEGCIIEDPNEGCIRGIHSEINAIGFAARQGISTEGAGIFVTITPCLRCSQAIIAAGITSVTYFIEHRDMRGVEYLKSNGVEVKKYEESEND